MKESKTETYLLFEQQEIRRVFDEPTQTWWFSVVDIIRVLTQQPHYQGARNYWKVLKNRLKREGSEAVTKCNQLKLPAEDGKMYQTDVATTETLLRLVQSIPSPKAEPIKLWLAKIGHERMQEAEDPNIAIERAKETWRKQGRSEKWIQQRLMSMETRHKLTEYWAHHDIKQGEEFSLLTNTIHQEWSDLTVQEHRDLKGLKSQNLRDHMTEAELIFTALAEFSTCQIAEHVAAFGLEQNQEAAKLGGSISRNARLALEKKTGQTILSSENRLAERATRSRSLASVSD